MKTCLLTLAAFLITVTGLQAAPSADKSAEKRLNEVAKITQKSKLDIERLLANQAEEGDRDTVNTLIGVRKSLLPVTSAAPKDTHWVWRSGGNLVLKQNGDATHTEWHRKGQWSVNPDGSIRIDAPTGTFRIDFRDDGVGRVTHLGKGGQTTITPRQ